MRLYKFESCNKRRQSLNIIRKIIVITIEIPPLKILISFQSIFPRRKTTKENFERQELKIELFEKWYFGF